MDPPNPEIITLRERVFHLEEQMLDMEDKYARLEARLRSVERATPLKRPKPPTKTGRPSGPVKRIVPTETGND